MENIIYHRLSCTVVIRPHTYAHILVLCACKHVPKLNKDIICNIYVVLSFNYLSTSSSMPGPDYEDPHVQLQPNPAYGTAGTANVVEGDYTYL